MADKITISTTSNGVYNAIEFAPWGNFVIFRTMEDGKPANYRRLIPVNRIKEIELPDSAIQQKQQQQKSNILTFGKR